MMSGCRRSSPAGWTRCAAWPTRFQESTARGGGRTARAGRVHERAAPARRRIAATAPFDECRGAPPGGDARPRAESRATAAPGRAAHARAEAADRARDGGVLDLVPAGIVA